MRSHAELSMADHVADKLPKCFYRAKLQPFRSAGGKRMQLTQHEYLWATTSFFDRGLLGRGLAILAREQIFLLTKLLACRESPKISPCGMRVIVALAWVRMEDTSRAGSCSPLYSKAVTAGGSEAFWRPNEHSGDSQERQ
jgi:hypothetical protein